MSSNASDVECNDENKSPSPIIHHPSCNKNNGCKCNNTNNSTTDKLMPWDAMRKIISSRTQSFLPLAPISNNRRSPRIAALRQPPPDPHSTNDTITISKFGLIDLLNKFVQCPCGNNKVVVTISNQDDIDLFCNGCDWSFRQIMQPRIIIGDRQNKVAAYIYLTAFCSLLQGATYDLYCQINKTRNLKAVSHKLWYGQLARDGYNAVKTVWDETRRKYVYPKIINEYKKLGVQTKYGIIPVGGSTDTRWQKRSQSGKGKHNSLTGTAYMSDALTEIGRAHV